MTPDLFRQAGELLHGRWFHQRLADDLGVSRKSVQRWDGGESPVPDGVWQELRALLAARSVALASVRRRLPR